MPDGFEIVQRAVDALNDLDADRYLDLCGGERSS
jgi:hypothetical protein